MTSPEHQSDMLNIPVALGGRIRRKSYVASIKETEANSEVSYSGMCLISPIY